jgi:hypothetical protein
MDQKTHFEEIMTERFAKLPPSVQAAITSADVEAHLRELAKHQQLHLDQWDLLENEVMLTLLGLAKTSELKQNIVKEVGVSEEAATIIANDIAQYVFQPIREELERQLEHPEARAVEVSEMDAVRTQALSDQDATNTPQTTTPQVIAPTIQTNTAPTAALSDGKVALGAVSATYAPQTPSHERKTIEGDPYREQVI